MLEDAPTDLRALLERVAHGDRDAFEAVYDALSPSLIALAETLTREARAADELVYETFIDLWRAMPSFEGTSCSVLAALSLEVRKRALARRIRTVSGAAMSADAHACDAITTLSPEERRLLELAFFEGLGAREIAARVPGELSAIRSTLANAVAKIRGGAA